jgi:hypothetical protein
MTRRGIRIMIMLFIVAVFVIGTSQIMAGKPIKKCPQPGLDCRCPLYGDPVVCKSGKKGASCSYTNMCFATCAGWDISQCSIPIPAPE